MDENNNYNNPYEEEEGLDFMALFRRLWDGRKAIIIWTVVFMLLGLVSALTMKRTYSVSSVMVPQMASKNNSNLSSLAALAGVDLGMNTSGTDISPLVYPQIVSSVPFRLELMNTPLHYAKADTAVSMLTYAKEYNKPSFMSKVKKYTIGLPFVILGAISGSDKKEEITLPAGNDADAPRPVTYTKDEGKMLPVIAECVSLAIDKKEGLITLNVVGSEPLQTAELALKAQEMLQREVTRFRTEKAEQDLEYIQDRYNETKAEAEKYQNQLAAINDRSQDVIGSRSNIQRERIQQKYSLANAIYTDMSKQLEQARMQVKRDTPVLAIVQPVTLPSKPSNSKAKTLIIWTFFGFILGCGAVFLKGFIPNLKKKFEEAGEADKEE